MLAFILDLDSVDLTFMLFGPMRFPVGMLRMLRNALQEWGENESSRGSFRHIETLDQHRSLHGRYALARYQ